MPATSSTLSNSSSSVDLPKTLDALKEETAASAHIHEAIMLGLEIETNNIKLLLTDSDSLFQPYQRLYDLQNKTFKINHKQVLSMNAYLKQLKAKEAIMSGNQDIYSENAGESYRQLINEYHAHLQEYILYIENCETYLEENCSRLKKMLIQGAVLNPVLQNIINSSPDILSNNPTELMLQLNKLNDAVFTGDVSYKDIFLKANRPLTQAELMQVEGYFNIIRQKNADKSLSQHGQTTDQSESKSAYDLMPGDEVYLAEMEQHHERIVLHRELLSLRNAYNEFRDIKSLEIWNTQYPKLKNFEARMNELKQQLAEDSTKFTTYDLSRYENLVALYEKYKKSNFAFIVSSTLGLAKSIIGKESQLILIAVEIAQLHADIRNLHNQADNFLHSKNAISEDRYRLFNEIYNKISRLGELRNAVDAIHSFIDIDDEVFALLSFSDDEKAMILHANKIIHDNDLKSATESIFDTQQYLAALSDVEKKITHNNPPAQLLYDLAPDEKIIYSENGGLEKQAKLHTIFGREGTSAETIAAFNYYLDIIEASVCRFQPDRDLFVRLITSPWGRSILKNSSYTEEGKRTLARVNTLNEAMLALYSDNILALDTKLFLQIEPDHFLISANKLDPNKHAARIVFANYGIQLTHETIKLILRQRTKEELIFTIEQQIWLANECRKKGAFNGMMSIVNGLTAVVKIIGGIKTCLTSEAQRILAELYALQPVNNGTIKSMVEQSDDAIPSLAHFVFYQSSLDESRMINNGQGNKSADLKATVSRLQNNLRTQTENPITLRAYKTILLDQKPDVEYDKQSLEDAKRVFNSGVVSLTPFLSEINVKPRDKEHINQDQDKDFNIEANLERHRLIELDRVMSELYADIAKLNIQANEIFQVIAQSLTIRKDITSQLLTELDSAYQNERSFHGIHGLLLFGEKYARQKLRAEQIQQVLARYKRVSEAIGENPAYLEILSYSAARFPENKELHHVHIEKWHRVLGVNAAAQFPVSPDVINKFERERQEKVNRLTSAFVVVDLVFAYGKAICECIELQRELDALYKELENTYEKNSEALKIIKAIRASASTGKRVKSEALMTLSNDSSVSQFAEKCSRYSSKLAEAKKAEAAITENPAIVFPDVDRTLIEKQRDLKNLLDEELAFIGSSIDSEYLLSEDQQSEVSADVKLPLSNHQIFLDQYHHEIELISRQLQNFDYKNTAILSYAIKNNLSLIRYIAEMRLGIKSNEQLFDEFCRGIPEPNPTEKAEFKGLLDLYYSVIKNIHLVRTHVEHEDDSNPDKNECLTNLDALESSLIKRNIREILSYDNPIAIKLLLERADDFVPFLNGIYIGESPELRAAIETEDFRRTQLRTISNSTLRELFLSKPGIVLSDAEIGSINSAIADCTVSHAQFNKLLRSFAVTVLVNETLFQRARREAIIANLQARNETIDVTKLESALMTANIQLEPLRGKLGEFNFRRKLSSLTSFSRSSNKQFAIMDDISQYLADFDPRVFANFGELYPTYLNFKAIHADKSSKDGSNYLFNIPGDGIKKTIDFCDESFMQYEKNLTAFRKLLTEWLTYFYEESQLQQANYNKIKEKIGKGIALTASDRTEIQKYQQSLVRFAAFVSHIKNPEKIQALCSMMGVKTPMSELISSYREIIDTWNQLYLKCLQEDLSVEPESNTNVPPVKKGLTILTTASNLSSTRSMTVSETSEHRDRIDFLQMDSPPLDNLIRSIRTLTNPESAKTSREADKLAYRLVANESNSTRKIYQLKNQAMFEHRPDQGIISYDPGAAYQFDGASQLNYDEEKHVVSNMVKHLLDHAIDKTVPIQLSGDERLAQKAAIYLYTQGFSNIYVHGEKFSPLDMRHFHQIPQILHKLVTGAPSGTAPSPEHEEERENVEFHAL